MKLKPHEILNHLGFDIGEEGVEINSNDAYFITQVLMLSGRTLDLDNIPTKDISTLKTVLTDMVAVSRNEPERDINSSTTKFVSSMRAILKITFKCHHIK